MPRAILPLWLFWVPLLLAILGFTWLVWSVPQWSWWYIGLIGLFFLTFGTGPSSTALQILRYAMFCRTVHGTRCSVHFPKELADRIKCDEIIQACESDLRELSTWFEVKLRRRVAIYLLDSEKVMHRMLGRRFSGFAHNAFNAILISVDAGLPVLRHELTHLYAWRLGLGMPRFKCEGLATWFEWGCHCPEIDEPTRRWLNQVDVEKLLSSRYFRNENDAPACYFVAGHFTDFVIRRFTWPKYRAFYRRANQFYFRRAFKRAFGVNFEQAISEWRKELAASTAC